MVSYNDFFKRQFTTTYNLLKAQVDGLAHEETLLQLPFRGNCLNWVIGHLVTSRIDILERLGEPRFWSAEETAIYDRGSEPITEANCEKAMRFEKLMEDWEHSQTLMLAALEHKTAEEWDVSNGRSTFAEQMGFLHFHEAYHVGQT